MSFWTSPEGVLRRARDKANRYKTGGSRSAFVDGWNDGAGQTEKLRQRDAYATGYNARIHHEQTPRETR